MSIKINNKNLKILCLIPARSGSKRIKFKNMKKLAGKPLIDYTVELARDIKLFDNIFVSTDSKIIADHVRSLNIDVPFLRPKNISRSLSPDILWVNHAVKTLAKYDKNYDIFVLLRPTNPFRTKKTLIKAINIFKSNFSNCDSLRAVRLCNEHPHKMWLMRSNYINPLFNIKIKSTPAHSSPYQALKKIYIHTILGN